MNTVMTDAELYEQSNFLQRHEVLEVLLEFKTKICWKQQDDRTMDVGCGDGSVTVHLLRQHMPTNFKRLLGCDISAPMVEYANRNHGDYRTEFAVMDIEGPMPEELLEKFDHIFSFFALHWVREQDQALRNIYNLLDSNGDCLLVFVGYVDLYNIFRGLSQQQKWSAHMKDVEKYISPYHDCVEPETSVSHLMEEMGFRDVDVRCRYKKYVYRDVKTLKNALAAINPFKIPLVMQEEFLEEIVKEMQLMDKTNDDKKNKAKICISAHYSLIIAYGKKVRLM